MTSEMRSIQPTHQAFYIQSMLFNTESAMASLSKITAVLHTAQQNSPEDPVAALPTVYLLNELQNVVIQAAALSRYFWPVRAAHNWRGDELRAAFGITDDNPLKSRDLRNAIEHFDEQLDRHLGNGITGVIIPQSVGLSTDLTDGVPIHRFRAYQVDAGIFQLLNTSYDIKPIAEAVLAVHEQLLHMDSNGGTFGRNRSG